MKSQDTLLSRLQNRVFFLLQDIQSTANRNTEILERRRFLLCGIGIIGSLLYYYLWTHVLPQPYESLTLRIIAVLILIPLLFSPSWPLKLRRFLTLYWHAVLLYILPFYFGFMFLMNNGNNVWAQSCLVAILTMGLLFERTLLILNIFFGFLLASFVYIYIAQTSWTGIFGAEQASVIIFAIIMSLGMNFSIDIIANEQHRAMMVTASSIAHELRTPLLGIRMGAIGTRGYLPALLTAYHLAKENGLNVPPIRDSQLEAMAGVLERIDKEATYANAIIDMLIIDAKGKDSMQSEKVLCSASRCVEAAIQRYPFTEQERKIVKYQIDNDFNFLGSELLTVHILFNMFKNAIRHISKAGRGEISIRFENKAGFNYIHFKDTGTGIDKYTITHIFDRFFSGTSGGNIIGDGIGLAFCRDAMRSFGGDIQCDSELNSFTEFILKFPPLPKQRALNEHTGTV